MVDAARQWLALGAVMMVLAGGCGSSAGNASSTSGGSSSGGASSTGTAGPCGPATCQGCCSASGVCLLPTADHCGLGGALCQTCGASQLCGGGVCQPSPTSSASSSSTASASSSSGGPGSSSSSGSTGSGASSASITSGSSGTSTSTSTAGSSGSSNSTGSSGSTGGADAGPDLTGATLQLVQVAPAVIPISQAVNPDAGDDGTATLTFLARYGDGTPAVGQVVAFQETTSPAALLHIQAPQGLVGPDGTASVQVLGQATPGVAAVEATLVGSTATATAQVTIRGLPANIQFGQLVPSVLGVQGFGVQEQGQAEVVVSDVNGVPVPDAAVQYSLDRPGTVQLDAQGATTDAIGQAWVPYHSNSVAAGFVILTASVPSAGVMATTTLGVVGTVPSAQNFYFVCASKNLPVYETTTTYVQVQCVVTLSDRYGNRIGIPTEVRFAAESGSFTGSGITPPFDPANPNSTSQGQVVVTYATTFGPVLGPGPVDVEPFEADPDQIPAPRPGEPRMPGPVGSGVVYNPRDQLVTLIAMARGEEDFNDANHNGVLEPTETFVDEGNPFVDANDTNTWDPASGGRAAEPYFCLEDDGGCPPYQPPNGLWDHDTLIWKPTWVVYSGIPDLSTIPPTGHLTDGGVVDEGFDAQCSQTLESLANIYAYDLFLNFPVAGTTCQATAVVDPPDGGHQFYGFFPTQDTLGSIALQTVQVSAADGGPCTISSGQACLNHVIFTDWNPGWIGQIQAKGPTGNPDQCSASFEYQVTTTSPNGLHTTATFQH